MHTSNLVKSISFREVPMPIIDDYSNFSIQNGLHVVINYINECHKLYISENFKTCLHKYYLYTNYFDSYDLIAFHMFRYIKEKCYFLWSNDKALWLLLRQKNSLIRSIVKFCLLKYFYVIARNYSD